MSNFRNTKLLSYYIACCTLVLLAVPALSEPKTLRQVQYVMGTTLDITIITDQEALAKLTLKQCFDQASNLDKLLSTYKTNSEITRLNSLRKLQLSPDTYEILKISKELSDLTFGYFDISYKAGFKDSYKFINLSAPNLVVLEDPRLEIDLGAIGKGYAVDKMAEILKKAKHKNWLINFGGSSIAASSSQTAIQWNLKLKVGTKDYPLILSNAFISNSGNFEEDHIVNPSTNREINYKKRLISIKAQNATIAEALSTAIFLEPKLAGRIEKKKVDFELLILD